MVIPKLTHERIREALHYSIITGEFFWLVPAARRRKIGDVAGNVNAQGYVQIQIDGENLHAQRLAIFWLTGEWPEERVDHQNRIRNDNRWLNIRIATYTESNQNRLTRAHNMAGVYWYGNNKPFSKIVVNKKVIPLGTFDTAAEAHEAYVAASLQHFGEYSPFYESKP